MELTTSNMESIATKFNYWRSKGMNADELSRKIYEEMPDFFQTVSDVLLLNKHDKTISYMYYNIACYISDDVILDEESLKQLINRLMIFYSKDSLYAEIYYILNKCVKIYVSFKKPRANVGLFLVKNMMFAFRDYLRYAYRRDRWRAQEEDLYEHHEGYTPYFEFDLLEEMLNVNDIWQLYTVGVLGNMLHFVLFLISQYDMTIEKTASQIGYTSRELHYFLEKNAPQIIEWRKQLGEIS